MSVQFTILGSGSNGNCAYLETEDTRILIDAGFSGKQIRERLAAIERVPERLTGILITHEHGDHTVGLKTIAAKNDIPVYCNRLTKEALENQYPKKLIFKIFNTGTNFELGDLLVESFSVPHDAYDPVGFLIRSVGGNIGFLTDLGHATRLIIERVRPANVLVLEANYDLHLLQRDTKRPWSTKQRIMSRHGHLSNDGAADVAEQIVSENLQQLYLGHLSQDCNRPDLAHEAVAGRLMGLGATHVNIKPAYQGKPTPSVSMAFA